jgi:hypothetical protein
MSDIGVKISIMSGQLTFHLKVICLCDIEQVITLGNLELYLGAILVNESHIDPTDSVSMQLNSARAQGIM